MSWYSARCKTVEEFQGKLDLIITAVTLTNNGTQTVSIYPDEENGVYETVENIGQLQGNLDYDNSSNVQLRC